MASSSNEAENDLDLDETLEFAAHVSDEDTEDASETETEKKDEEFTGIKDQMYHDRLSQYKRQLVQLKDGSLPLYIRKLKKFDQLYKDRLFMNEIIIKSQMEMIERDYQKEKEAAVKEFEERKVELRDGLIKELEHKRKMIENERQTMELTGDTMSVKPITTRKLRRRPNDPVPIPEKRSKPSPVQLTSCLDEQEIAADIAIINKVCKPKLTAPAPIALNHGAELHEVSIEDGRLCYDKRWFSKDQQIIVESKDHGRYNACIVNVNTDEISVKKLNDSAKIRIPLSQLQKGFYTIKKKT